MPGRGVLHARLSSARDVRRHVTRSADNAHGQHPADHVELTTFVRPDFSADLALRSEQVSAECRDLIARMLTVDPRDRISVADIQQHPWFQQDLPMGTLEVNTQLQQTDSARQAKLLPAHARTHSRFFAIQADPFKQCSLEYSALHEKTGLHPPCKQRTHWHGLCLPVDSAISASLLKMERWHWCRRFGPCKQSAEEILELVAACNAERGGGMRRRVSDLRQRQQEAQQLQQPQSKPQPLRSVTPSHSHHSSQSHASM